MVFGNCGVLEEMAAEKGYVEMTGIDAETSQDIAEVLNIIIMLFVRVIFICNVLLLLDFFFFIIRFI